MNKAYIEARRLNPNGFGSEHQFGGINETDNQRNSSFGGINESEHQRNSRTGTQFGGVNETDNHRNSGTGTQFGGVNETDNQRNSGMATRWTPDDNNWLENLNRAEQYFNIHGNVPKSCSAHLSQRKECLSEEEISEKQIIQWCAAQRSNYRRGRQSGIVGDMSQMRKDKLRTSGIRFTNKRGRVERFGI